MINAYNLLTFITGEVAPRVWRKHAGIAADGKRSASDKGRAVRGCEPGKPNAALARVPALTNVSVILERVTPDLIRGSVRLGRQLRDERVAHRVGMGLSLWSRHARRL